MWYFYIETTHQFLDKRIQTVNMKRIENLPIIQTERLVLRQWCSADLDPLSRMNADPRVMEYFQSVLMQEESSALLQRAYNHIEEHGWGKWAVALKETGEFIGRIGLEDVDFHISFSSNLELGYRLAFEHWGKGYASEGASAVLKYGFNYLNLNEIVAFTPVQNLRSQLVMERIGMHHDPRDDFDHPKLPKNHHLQRHVLYRISHQDWQQDNDDALKITQQSLDSNEKIVKNKDEKNFSHKQSFK